MYSLVRLHDSWRLYVQSGYSTGDLVAWWLYVATGYII